MNKKRQSLSFTIERLDNWSNETINNSFLGKLFSLVKNRLQGMNKSCPYSFPTLMISLGALFASLSLPQFANDRFGVGIIIIFCFFIFLLNLFSNKSISASFNSIDFLILVFLLGLTISTLSSYFLRESFTGFIKYFIFLLYYFLLKITMLNCSQKSFLNLWAFLFLCAVITASIGIYQNIVGVEPLATWEDPMVENIHTRVYSTLGNPNLLAGYLLGIFPLGIILPFERKASAAFKVFFLIGVFLILFCLIFTGSRGGYLGLIAEIVFSIIVFLNYMIKRKGLLNQTLTISLFFVSIIIIFTGLIFLFPHITERISTIFTLREHSSNNYRVNVWLACFKMLKDNWIVGIGPGNNTFRLAYGLYMVSGFDALAAYNIFLELAIEAGILGCLTFIFIFLISFIKLHYLFWEKGNILAFGIFISLIGLLTHGLVDTVFFRPQVFVPFWFLLASIAKLKERSS